MTGSPHAMPPVPRLAFLRAFTIHVFNPLSRHVVRWLPGFALIEYRGRRSGRRYRTPINAFRRDDQWVFALTYSSRAQWVRNVLAAGDAFLIQGRHRVHLVDPRLVMDGERRLVPVGVRQILGLMRVSEFLLLRIAG